MVDLRLELAADCPKIAAGKFMDLCRVSTWIASEDFGDLVPILQASDLRRCRDQLCFDPERIV
jgi:hypothetical protein